MIGYVTLGSNDMPKALAFYDDLLGTIGAKRTMEFGDETGKFVMYGVSPTTPGLAITTPYNREPATIGNGTMPALIVDERARVDALHARALALGGTCEGPPGLRGEEGPQAFYAAYFRDLDGNKLCAFRVGPA